MRIISVCLATYNGERYIKDQIASILKQLGEADEIIISDDNSTDNTISIIKGFNDPRIKIFINNKKNVNHKFEMVTNNFQNALINCSGDLIFLADQDDIWLNGKVESVSGMLNKFSLVLTDCKIVDENLKVLNDSYFSLNSSKKGINANLKKNAYLGCCMAFRKEILDIALPFPNVPHDIWIGLIAEYFSDDVCFLNEPFLLYRRHGGNLSPSGEKSTNGLYFKISYRLNIVVKLIKRIIKAKYENITVR